MHGCRESDRFRVPRKPSNKGCPKEPAEEVEGRERAKGNVAQQSRGRTQRRGALSQVLDRVRQAAVGVGMSCPEAGARCGSAARRDLCGGCRVTGIPTATFHGEKKVGMEKEPLSGSIKGLIAKN